MEVACRLCSTPAAPCLGKSHPPQLRISIALPARSTLRILVTTQPPIRFIKTIAILVIPTMLPTNRVIGKKSQQRHRHAALHHPRNNLLPALPMIKPIPQILMVVLEMVMRWPDAMRPPFRTPQEISLAPPVRTPRMSLKVRLQVRPRLQRTCKTRTTPTHMAHHRIICPT